MENKKTIVLGASPNPERYSFRAVSRLKANGHTVVGVGRRKGEISGLPIRLDKPQEENVHTIAMYLSPDLQREYYEYILSLHPKRVIFNPGTQNMELMDMLENNGIEVVDSCVLVLLTLNEY